MRKIRDMLDAGLPPGAPITRVTLYLDSRSFEYQISDNGRKVIASIHKVDEETLTPH